MICDIKLEIKMCFIFLKLSKVSRHFVVLSQTLNIS